MQVQPGGFVGGLQVIAGEWQGLSGAGELLGFLHY